MNIKTPRDIPAARIIKQIRKCSNCKGRRSEGGSILIASGRLIDFSFPKITNSAI